MMMVMMMIYDDDDDNDDDDDIQNHPWKNKFADFTKFGSFANVFLLLFSVC